MQPNLTYRDNRELGVVAAFWTLITATIFWPVVIGAKSAFFGDLALYFIPQFGNIATALHEGKLLFWNHSILGGVPHVGNPQGWLLYPTVWLNAFLPPWHVAGIIPVIHIPIAAVGMHFLSRRIGFSLLASMVAAGTFAFSSVLLTKAQFPNMVQAIAWTPWLITAVIRCIRGHRLALLRFSRWSEASPFARAMHKSRGWMHCCALPLLRGSAAPGGRWDFSASLP